ncbi:MAG: hypothetical protein RIR26_131 [Pseudomonadota bacterium]
MSAGLLLACTKSKTPVSVEQDVLVRDMMPHNFATEGYAILNGGWSGTDFTERIFSDERYGKENFITFDTQQKLVQMLMLDGESKAGMLPPPASEETGKIEANLNDLIRSEKHINTPAAVTSFLRVGGLLKDYNAGTMRPVSVPFTVVTNRDELPYSPKPTTGPEWNEFIRSYCGGFQNQSLGFIWVEGTRKICLRLWTGPSRQLLKIRTLVTLPRSHTSSVLDARVSPWLTMTRDSAPVRSTDAASPDTTESATETAAKEQTKASPKVQDPHPAKK